jgi:hypothetical protein
MIDGTPYQGGSKPLSKWLAEPGKFTSGGDCWRFTPEFGIGELQRHVGNMSMVLPTPLGRVAFDTITEAKGDHETWFATGHVAAFANTERGACVGDPVELVYTLTLRGDELGHIRLRDSRGNGVTVHDVGDGPRNTLRRSHN